MLLTAPTPPLLRAAALHWPAVLPRLRWHLHTPYAFTLCVVEHTELSGIASGLRFGTHAHITLVRMVPDAGAALHAALVNALAQTLAPEGSCTAVVPPEQEALWTALGFVPQELLLRFSSGVHETPTHNEVEPLEPHHRLAVLHLDRRAHGLERHAMLLEHAYLGRVYHERGHVRGFYLPLLDGLIVADVAYAGHELQRWLLPTQGHVLLHDGTPAVHALEALSWQREAVGLRMMRGAGFSTRQEMVYGVPFGAV
jgi:hypothetical protein